MNRFFFQQGIKQLEKRKGGYYYLMIEAETVAKFEQGRAVRLKCIIDNAVSFSCGLNHLGDGDFYIIVAARYLKTLGKQRGSIVEFEIFEDPNPLGVELPETIQVLLDQDKEAKSIYEELTDGKKRSLIYSVNKIKNVDIQVKRILEFLEKAQATSRKRQLK